MTLASALTPGPGPERKTCQAFHLFTQLPPELRIKIWAYNLPPPRIVSIRCGASDLSPSPPPGSGSPPRPSTYGCSSSAPIPANLHACAESRHEALRRYRAMFGIARQPGQILFDPDRDVLYFGPRDGYMAAEAQFRTVLALAPVEELARVRRVAVNDLLFWVDRRPGRGQAGRSVDQAYVNGAAAGLTIELLNEVRLRLPGLRELVFIPRDGNPLYSSEATLVDSPIRQTRMERQIAAAVRAARAAHPDWKPPQWSVKALSAVAEPIVYERSVMGFGAGRNSFEVRANYIRESVLRYFETHGELESDEEEEESGHGNAHGNVRMQGEAIAV